MTYNLTQLYNATTASDLLVVANAGTNGKLAGIFVMSVFVIMLFRLKRNFDFDRTILASSWVCFLIAAILSYGGYLTLLFPLGFLVIAALTAIYLMMA